MRNKLNIIESIKLINPRGRTVLVKPHEVQKLLSRGFLRAPKHQQNYNPVFDKMENIRTDRKALKNIDRIERAILNVEKI